MSCILHSCFPFRVACFLTEGPVVLQAANIGDGVWSCKMSEARLNSKLALELPRRKTRNSVKCLLAGESKSPKPLLLLLGCSSGKGV